MSEASRRPSSSFQVRLLMGTLVIAGLVGCAGPVESPEPPGYAAEIEEWRRGRLERLTSDSGWLTLVGLFWFEDGEHSIGSEPGSAIELLSDKAPAHVGVLRASGDELTLEVDPSVEVTHDGERVESLVLADDTPGPSTLFELGDLSAHVIQRDDQRALRVKDRNHPARFSFVGIESFPTDWSRRLVARFESYDPPRTIPIPTVLGTITDQPSSGAVVFEIDGSEHRLDVVAEPGDEQLFIIFGDQTSGHETYGGGRYLYADAPGPDGTVVVDFNRAYNPPCVLTAFATCPLPPPQNKLPIRVEAGEKNSGFEK